MPEYEVNWAAVHVEATARATVAEDGTPTATIDAVYIVSGYRGLNSLQVDMAAAATLRDSLDVAIKAHVADSAESSEPEMPPTDTGAPA
ncbi:hypothetical protein H9W91_07110 [Streptomyces alfalfae]|uniref:hypothetical protein n=1 Tax=Streptomyces alfalfae TaxID=1642299 RepID=UPI001BA8D127|nr:hypothetical protein [Streptomyces alfalfae]QUI30657.1 hypothetical protein H9W91_07110 [Streptomyces alfalfae]